MRLLRALSSILLLLSVACSTLPEGQKSTAAASGPPEIEAATIERHARQFDEEEPVREAGSQEELAASAYVVAHLTDAGYVFRLDAVPVQDLVRSTNVVALPPGGSEPEAIVVAGYDSTEGSKPSGHAIGAWLEVARALRAAERDHAVEFVALGAEEARVGGGSLGSRRLAQQLADDDKSPAILVVDGIDAGAEDVTVSGSAADALVQEAGDLGLDVVDGPPAAGAAIVFERAGFDTTTVGGDPEGAARVLLAYLATL